MAVTSTSISATATIRPVGGGTTAYSETHSVTTDANGLLSIVVGEGSPTSGNTLADVDWGAASYEINVTTNPGATNITFPIYSAPTALYSVEAGSAVTGGSGTPGAVTGNVREISSTTPVNATDYIIIKRVSSFVILQLPNPATMVGRIIKISNNNSNSQIGLRALSGSIPIIDSDGTVSALTTGSIGQFFVNARQNITIVATSTGWVVI